MKITKDLAEEYLNNLIDTLRHEKTINKAVFDRDITYVKSEKGLTKVNLASIKERFDSKGNLKDTEGFLLKDPERTKDEMKFLVKENLSDWEKIALVSAYFTCGVDLISNNPPIPTANKSLEPKINTIAEAIRIIVAKAVRDTAGFVNSPGYQIRKEFIERLNLLKTHSQDIHQKAILDAKFVEQLKNLRGAAVQLKKHFEEKGRSNKSKNVELDQQKLKVLDATISAIEGYTHALNINAFKAVVTPLIRDEELRKIGIIGDHKFHHLMLEELKPMLDEHVRLLEKFEKNRLDHPHHSHVMLFDKSVESELKNNKITLDQDESETKLFK